jgi:hypothetical protein
MTMSDLELAGDAGGFAHNPTTGEAIDLHGPAVTIADELELIDQATDALKDYRGVLVRELARRADNKAARKVTVDGLQYEVNAPTEDVYTLEAINRELEPLVSSGDVDAEILESLVRYPPRPPAPAPAVDKRRLNALLASDNRILLSALARARQRRTNTRTVKVLARIVEATAEEDTTP